MDSQLIFMFTGYGILISLLLAVLLKNKSLQAQLKQTILQEQLLREEYEEATQVFDVFCKERAIHEEQTEKELLRLNENNEQLHSKLHQQLFTSTRLQIEQSVLQLENTILSKREKKIMENNETLLHNNRILLDREKRWIQIVKNLTTLSNRFIKIIKENSFTTSLEEKIEEVLFKEELDGLLSRFQIIRSKTEDLDWDGQEEKEN